MGLLEKHSDYVKRAKKFHENREKLLLIKKKADKKNINQYFFAMDKSPTINRDHLRRKPNSNCYISFDSRFMMSKIHNLMFKANRESMELEKLKIKKSVIGISENSVSHLKFENRNYQKCGIEFGANRSEIIKSLTKYNYRSKRLLPERCFSMNHTLNISNFEQLRLLENRETNKRNKRMQKLHSSTKNLVFKKKIDGQRYHKKR